MRKRSAGFSLVEAVVGLTILMIGLLSAAPLLISALKTSAAGADLSMAGALAVERLERLRSEDFGDLDAGGDLDANAAGFSDTSQDGFNVRWFIVDGTPPTTKTITVRVLATRAVSGLAKEATLTTLRAQ